MLIFNLDLNELLIIKWIRKEKEKTENKNIDKKIPIICLSLKSSIHK